VAIGLGPGSYAGIRSAIAVAQGWQLATNLRLLGLSSVDALAHQAQTAGRQGRVHLIIDAQRDEFYAATYLVQPDSVQIESPLRLISAADADALVQKGGAMGDSELVKRWPQLHLLLPDAAAIGQLAAARTDFVPGDTLQPIYLRETNFVKAPPPRVIT
jgi:tRNA threonylcarbamoyl adenosine modification protein YeaZ